MGMKTLLIVMGMVLGTSPLFAQESPEAQAAAARERADDARQKCAALLQGLDGISSIGMGGAGADYRLLIVVRDLAAQRVARTLLGGEPFQGLKILWTIPQPSSEVPRRSAPAIASAPDRGPDPAGEPKAPSRVAASSVSPPVYSSNELWPQGWTQPWIAWTHTDRGWEVRRNHYFLFYGNGHKPYRY
jgi:hypothetical protein